MNVNQRFEPGGLIAQSNYRHKGRKAEKNPAFLIIASGERTCDLYDNTTMPVYSTTYID